MDDIEEKRVYDDRAGKTELLVAAAVGVLAVDVAADRVGRFGVAHRCDPLDVAAGGGRVAVATVDDVLLREPGAEDFAGAGFGPAAAVGFDGDAPVAASPDGDVSRLDVEGTGGGDADDTIDDAGDAWTDLGHLDADVRAIDGRLVAAADGVYRLPGLDYAGLDDVRDVAATGPLAATGDGLYSLGNGWLDEVDGDFQVVTVAPGRTGGAGAATGTAHAATDGAFFERADGEWRAVDLPVDGAVVDAAYGDVAYAVTAEGDVVADGEDGWRAHPLGVDGVVGCAVA